MSRRIVLLIILLCAGCSAFRIMVDEPSWIKGPPVFEKGGYVYGVGFSSEEKGIFEQKQAAEDSAKVRICRFLGVGEIKLYGDPLMWHDEDGKTTYVLIRCLKE